MTFNVLIATRGRPTLQRMLDSLSPQLLNDDCLTIVFDGHRVAPVFDTSSFKCPVQIHCEPVALGYWGHGIRNKYARLLERRDFVMHADDDNIYLSDAFSQLRTRCLDKHTLYVAQVKSSIHGMLGSGLKRGKIDTGCGIIPYDLNQKCNWEYYHGGDGSFYEGLAKLTKPEFLPTLIQYWRPSEAEADAVKQKNQELTSFYTGISSYTHILKQLLTN